MSIEIEKVEEWKVRHVYTDKGLYVRYGAKKWMEEMGFSLKRMSECEEIEAAFQDWCHGDALRAFGSLISELKDMVDES